VSTIGGTTIGRIVITSMRNVSRGKRSRTRMTVGSISSTEAAATITAISRLSNAELRTAPESTIAL
jgi:hypothetical protein